MSDRYLGFANSNLGRRLVDALGLPRPAPLERWQAGRLRPVEGALVLGGGPWQARSKPSPRALPITYTVSMPTTCRASLGSLAWGRKSKPWCSTPVTCPTAMS